MAVGLRAPEKLQAVGGVLLAAKASGVKSNGGSDLLLISLSEGSSVAGVFTRNAYCAAPVTLAKKHLEYGNIRALLVNSGNANAGTGEQGMSDAKTLCEECAKQLGLDASQVLPFSTGVIGELLPVDKIKTGIHDLAAALRAEEWLNAATAIMTTDTLPKAVTKQVVIDKKTITLTGISKGSGMIHPDMATMLAFIATDGLVDQSALQRALSEITARTFNCITVDGDTSTNDSFIGLATGTQANDLLDESHPQWSVFYSELEDTARTLAHAIVRDGEGATRFIEIEVNDGPSGEMCRQVGFTVAHSPLVKTAFFAGDPNLGRILAAVGRSKVPGLDMDRVSLNLGDLPVIDEGQPSTSYREADAAKIMSEGDVKVQISLGMGNATATVWTTDLSYDYVKINAEYRS